MRKYIDLEFITQTIVTFLAGLLFLWSAYLEQDKVIPYFLFVSMFVIASMMASVLFVEALTKIGRKLVLRIMFIIFLCGLMFTFGKLSAQSIDVEVRNSLITDFNRFVVATTNCNSKTPECEGINSKYVSEYNTINGTNHRTLWDIYVNISAIELQKVLLSQPTKMRGNSNQASQVSLLKAKNDTLLLLLRNKEVQIINLTNDNLLKDSIIVSQRNEILGMEKYAVSCEVILPNDVLITHKGLYVNTRNDKLISNQFIEENREVIEKVSTGVYIYKPSKGLDTPTIIKNATYHKKRLLSVDWKRVANKENNLATK